jgi:WD40 repeat protein
LRTLSGHAERVNAVAFSPDGKRALSGGDDGTLKLWDLADAKAAEPRTLAGHRRAVTCVAFSADGKQLLSGSKDRTLRLWDAATGKKVQTFVGHDNWVTAAALSPDGKRVLSVSDDGSVKLWDAAEGEELDHIAVAGSNDVPGCAAFAPDGRSFVVGTADGVILRFEGLCQQSP